MWRSCSAVVGGRDRAPGAGRRRAPRASRNRGSCARSRPARRAGSPPPRWSISTATGGWRSSRRPTARRCSTRAGGCSARARRPRGASTPRASSRTSTGTARARSWSAATTGRSPPTCSPAAAAGQAGLAGLDVQRRAVPRDARARRGGPRPATAGSRSSRRRPTRRGPARRCSSFDAAGRVVSGWPRYNAADAGFNGVGNHGYGAYGENVGIGELDDDPQLEIVVTFDNHQINLFNHDGTSVLASPWYRNRQSDFAGARLGWGQFIRWLDPRRRGRPLPPPHRPVARRARRRRGCSGPPPRRRSPTSTATAATR